MAAESIDETRAITYLWGEYRDQIQGTLLKTVHRIVMTPEYIVEGQRLSIAQNKTLKFLYQTWWTWWLPRVGIVAFIVYFLVEGFEWYLVAEFGAFLALSIFGEWWGKRRLATARQKLVSSDPISVSMDENGVDIVGVNGNSHSNWTGLPTPVIRVNGVLLMVSRLSGIWLPDSALIEGSAQDVRNLLAESGKAPPKR